MKTKKAGLLLLLLTLPLTAEFTVHEWGTFTQVIASDGTILDGLEREEEPLPPFVHSHAGLQNSLIARKGFRRPVQGVNTKMETPVIYFYTDQALQAEVEVQWKGGSISQWYPQRTGGETPPAARPIAPVLHPDAILSNSDFTKRGGIDFTKVTTAASLGKSMSPPQINLTKPTSSKETRPPTGSIPACQMRASSPAAPNQKATFSIAESVASTAASTSPSTTPMPSRFQTPSSTTFPFALVFQNDGRTIRSKVLTDGLSAGTSLTIPDQDLNDLGYVNSPWQSTVYRQMREGLVQAGLFQDEAEGMIQTWWSSYFAKPSFNGSPRVFWILPTAQVDEVLPLTINPKPQKTVRVIVGRAEILRPSFEKTFLAMDRNAQGLPTPIAHDRFALAYRARIQQLESSAKLTPSPTLIAQAKNPGQFRPPPPLSPVKKLNPVLLPLHLLLKKTSNPVTPTPRPLRLCVEKPPNPVLLSPRPYLLLKLQPRPSLTSLPSVQKILPP